MIRVSFFSSVYVAYNFLRFLTRSFNLFKWCCFGFFFFSRFLYARMCFLLSQCTILPIRSDVAYILRSRMIFRPSSVRFLFARNRFMHFWDFSFCFFKSSEIQVIWDSNNVNEILVGYQNYERFDVCGFFRNSKYWVSDNFSRALWILVVYYFL